MHSRTCVHVHHSSTHTLSCAGRPKKAFGTPRVPEEPVEPAAAAGPATQEPAGLTEAALGPRGTSPA
eukprot:scaffold94941_cov22-Tisochrysis_lutea.AAC.1